MQMIQCLWQVILISLDRLILKNGMLQSIPREQNHFEKLLILK
jgi:hypothetical protein